MYDFRFRRQNYCFFFDMSDHKIVGGCSTLLAKSNKKCIFRDQGLVYIKKMLYLCSDFKSSLSSGPPSGERKKIPYYNYEQRQESFFSVWRFRWR